MKLMLATPSYDARFDLSYVGSLIRTIAELGHEIDMLWWPRCGDSLLPASRNAIAAEFLAQPERTHLLWIDSDIAWSPKDIVDLLGHDVDLVAGAYHAKDPWRDRADLIPLPSPTGASCRAMACTAAAAPTRPGRRSTTSRCCARTASTWPRTSPSAAAGERSAAGS